MIHAGKTGSYSIAGREGVLSEGRTSFEGARMIPSKHVCNCIEEPGNQTLSMQFQLIHRLCKSLSLCIHLRM